MKLKDTCEVTCRLCGITLKGWQINSKNDLVCHCGEPYLAKQLEDKWECVEVVKHENGKYFVKLIKEYTIYAEDGDEAIGKAAEEFCNSVNGTGTTIKAEARDGEFVYHTDLEFDGIRKRRRW